MLKKLDSPETHRVKAFPIKGAKFNVLGLLFLSDGVSLVDKTSLGKGRFRNLLPEPFDWFNHAGNFSLSMYTGAAVSCMSALALVKCSEQSSSSVRRLALGIGVASVGLINSLTETRWGINLTGGDSIPDTIDLVYGVGAGAIGASIVSVEQSQASVPAQVTS